MSRYRNDIDGLLNEIQYYVEDLEDDLADLEDENWELERELDELRVQNDYRDLQSYMFNNHPNGAHVEWDSVLGKWVVDGKVL